MDMNVRYQQQIVQIHVPFQRALAEFLPILIAELGLDDIASYSAWIEPIEIPLAWTASKNWQMFRKRAYGHQEVRSVPGSARTD